MRNSLAVIALALAALACSGSGTDAPPVAPEPRAADPALTPLAQRAIDIMAALERDPEHHGQQGAFLEVLEEIYGRETLQSANPSTRVYHDALVRANQYAMAGSGLFLEAVMMASLGPYGDTAEGSEGIMDMLWTNFETNPQLTIAVLAEIGPDIRTRLIDEVYTQPPHEYDFARIAEELRGTWEEEVAADVQRILPVVAPPGEGTEPPPTVK